MTRTLCIKFVSCLMLVVFPASLFAADQASAMVYSHGPALLNGNNIPRMSAIFSGDLVQTNKDSVANINATGSTVLVLNDSLVQYEGNSVSLEHGGVTISTSKTMATRAGDVVITPVSSASTEFEVRDLDGAVKIVARKGDLTISDDTGTSTLAQGQETTREEQSEKKKRKKRAGAGTAPAAGGGVLNSPVAVGIGTGAIAGVAAWALIQSDEPVSRDH